MSPKITTIGEVKVYRIYTFRKPVLMLSPYRRYDSATGLYCVDLKSEKVGGCWQVDLHLTDVGRHNMVYSEQWRVDFVRLFSQAARTPHECLRRFWMLDKIKAGLDGFWMPETNN